MREILSLHIGKAGIQIGNECWNLLKEEHKKQSENAFFTLNKDNELVPRAINIDLEPTENAICGVEDAANNYARGFYTVGAGLIDEITDKLENMVEECESLQGFFIYRSMGGGTGSGLGSLIMRHISEHFSKKSKLEFSILPAPQSSTAVVEPYNAVLTTSSTINAVDCSFLMDNGALYNLTNKGTFSDFNNRIAQVVSAITASLRFPGSLNVDLNEFQTNLVPFPNIHYPLISYSFQKNENIVSQCFNEKNQLLQCSMGKFMACCMLFRGDVSSAEINKSTVRLKKQLDFVAWSPTGFKIGINSVGERACCLLANTTGVGQTFEALGKKFDKMFSKRAYVHWYVGEGMEEAEFNEARDILATLEDNYKEIAAEE